MTDPTPTPFRIAFVPGVTPDKWARIWRERHPDLPLELSLVSEEVQRVVLDEGATDMALVRLPIDRDGLHLIPLYEEQPVVVVPKDHPVAAYDEIPLTDLADEQLVAGTVPGWSDIQRVTPLPFPEMTVKDAIEVVASGTGIAILPMSVARLHHRKDVVHRIVRDVPTTQVGLAWPITSDDPRVESFVGIVRGRRPTSSRGGETARQAPGQHASPKEAARGKPRKGASPQATRQGRKAGRPAVRKPRRRR